MKLSKSKRTTKVVVIALKAAAAAPKAIIWLDNKKQIYVNE